MITLFDPHKLYMNFYKSFTWSLVILTSLVLLSKAWQGGPMVPGGYPGLLLFNSSDDPAVKNTDRQVNGIIRDSAVKGAAGTGANSSLPGTVQQPQQPAFYKGNLGPVQTATVMPQDELPALEPGMVNVTKDAAGFLLSGTNGTASRLAIETDPEKIPAGYRIGDVYSFFYDKNSRHWLQIKRDSIDLASNMLYSTVANDGDYINAIIKLPEAPETQGFVPTTMNDLKVGDPASMVQTIEAPQANKDGSASLSYQIETPPGRLGMQPNLLINYNSDGGNGLLGEGWNLGGISSITVDTRWGVPLYDSTVESETYMLDGKMLAMATVADVPQTANRVIDIPRKADRNFYVRTEENFNQIVRTGNAPGNYLWVITDKAGTKYYYGGVGQERDAVLADEGKQKIAEWKLRKVEDLYGNSIAYHYSSNSFSMSGNLVKSIVLKKIVYTFSKNVLEHILQLYQVDLDYVSSFQRKDVQVNARYGFLISNNNQLLSEILVRIIQYKNVEQNELSMDVPIRKYGFHYKYGEFDKTVLDSMSQYGFNNDKSAALFNTHRFGYHNFNDINNNYFSEPQTITAPDIALLGSSETKPKIGVGGAVGVGAPDGQSSSKSLSAAAQFSYKESASEGQSAFMDMNGDGLPDYVYKKGDDLHYRINEIKNNNLRFGAAANIEGVQSFSKDNGTAIGGGFQVNGPSRSKVFLGQDFNVAHNYSPIYVTDANGDGLPDIVDNSTVKFNTARNGSSNLKFETSSKNTPNPLTAGKGIDSKLMLDGTASDQQKAYNVKVSPLHDVVRLWIAPDSGTIQITAPIRLIQPVIDSMNIEDSLKYKRADGVVYSIQQNNSPMVAQTLINKGDYTAKNVTAGSYRVAKGDHIIFRLQSGTDKHSNGDFDQVIWNPEIAYTSKRMDKNVVDLFGDSVFIFNAGKDHLPATGSVLLPDSGSFSVKSSFKKPVSRDSVFVKVRLVAYQIAGSKDTLITVKRQSEFNFNDPLPDTSYPVKTHTYGIVDSMLYFRVFDTAAGSININLTNIPYDHDSRLYFEISSASNINYKAIEWVPEVACKHIDTTELDVRKQWKNDTAHFRPNIHFKGNLLNAGTVLSLKDSGDVIIYPRLTFNPRNLSPIKLVVSDTHAVITKRILADSVDASQPFIVTIDKDRPFFIHYELDNLDQCAVEWQSTVMPAFDAFFPDYNKWTAPKAGLYSFYAMNKGELRRSKYQKNNEPLSAPIESDSLERFMLQAGDRIKFIDTTNGAILKYRVNIPEAAAVFADPIRTDLGNLYRGWGYAVFNSMPSPNQYIDTTILKAERGQKNNLFEVRFFSMMPDSSGLGLRGPNDREYISGDTVSSSRLAMPDVQPVDVFALKLTVNAQGAMAPARYSKTQTSTSSVGGGPGSINEGNGTSVSVADYVDLNGDRYPDMVNSGSAQYTNALGGLSDQTSNFGSSVLSKSTVKSIGFNLGGNFDHPTKINDNSKAQASKNVSAGSAAKTGTLAGVSGGMNFNDDNTDQVLYDINGDGLPDRVIQNSVFLNLGYSFAKSAINWNVGTLQKSRSQTTSFGGGINIDNNSFSAGINKSGTKSWQQTAIADMNGDGLPDQVSIGGGQLSVRFNLGNVVKNDAFSIPDLSSLSNTDASSWGLSSSFTVSPNFPLPPIKLVFNFSAGTAGGTSTTKSQLTDINGDGFVDFIEMKENGTALVYYSRMGSINKLSTVNRPLGGSFVIHYKHNPASYDHPGGKWVMASVLKKDGIADDGDNATAVFDYADGRYDRFEREFLGFGKVTRADMLDNKIARKSIQEYATGNYYTAGNLTEERIEDSAGNKYNVTVYTYYVRVREKVSERIVQEVAAPVELFTGIIQTPLKSVKKYAYEGNNATKVLLSQAEYRYDSMLNVTKYNYREGDNPALASTAFMTTISYLPLNDLNVHGLPVAYEITDSRERILRKQKANYYSDREVFKYKLQSDTVFFDKNNVAVTKYEFDAYGQLKTKISPDGFQTTYSRDQLMQIYLEEIVEKYKAPLANRFAYDLRFGVDTQRILTNGKMMRTTMDQFGRVVKIADPRQSSPDATTTAFTIFVGYDHNAPVPNSVVRHYDEENKTEGIYTLSFIDGFKRSVQVKKSGIVNNKKVLIVSGRQQFDQLERPVKSYYPVTEDYNVSNNKVDSRGTTFNAAFDGIQPTIKTYDLLDRELTITLPDGKLYATNQYTIAKDGFNNDAQVTITSFTSNKKANRKEVFTNGSGLPSTEAYYLDNNNSTKKMTLFRYNPVHQLDTVYNKYKNGHYLVAANRYDWAGRRTIYYNINSGHAQYSYDAIGKLRQRISAGGYITNYTYTHNRLTGVDHPAHPEDSVRYFYGDKNDNNLGQLVFRIDATGAQSFNYDEFGNVIENRRSIIAPFDSVYTFITRYSYDTWNRMLEMVYPGGEKLRYVYNTAGLLEELYGSRFGSVGKDFAYIDKITYDKFEQRESITYGNKTKTNYTYEPLRRRLQKVATDKPSGNIMTSTYAYDELNNITLAKNVSQLQSINLMGLTMTHNYTYDNQSQLQTANGNWKGGNATYALTMGYDDQLNIQSKSLQLVSGQVKRRIDAVYTYAAANPLRLVGMRESISRKKGTEAAYKEVNDQLYTYDKEGRDLHLKASDSFQANIQERKIFWDEENRIKAISSNGYVSSYTYDANGERTIKLSAEIDGVYVNGRFAADNNKTSSYSLFASPYYSMRNSNGMGTKHIYVGTERIVSQLTNHDNWDQNAEEPATRKPLTITPILLTEALATYHKSVKVDYPQKLLKQESVINGYFDSLELSHKVLRHGAFIPWPKLQYPELNDPANPGQIGTVNMAVDENENLRYFYHSNYLRSTGFITDTGARVLQYIEYLPFGETFMEQRKDYSSQFLFNGKEQDAETGLYYYGARYYDPKTYQWLGVDPMAEKYAGMNPYGFCFNNPIRNIDPDGRQPYSLLNESYKTNIFEHHIQFGPDADRNAMKAESKDILRGIMKEAGISTLTITSTQRNAEQQRDAMFVNIDAKGVKSQKKLYGKYGDQVIDQYPDKDLMLSKINEVGLEKVSKHGGNPDKINVFDIAPSSVLNKKAFEKSVNSSPRINKFLTPTGQDPAYHLEIRQTDTKYYLLDR